MSVNYSSTAINDRLLGVITAIDSGGTNGTLKLYASGTLVSTIQLARPCGTVNGGVLTFSGTLLDPSAAATGFVNTATISNSVGDVQINGLTVGIPFSGADITLVNGLNNTKITAGQVVSCPSAQIIGS